MKPGVAVLCGELARRILPLPDPTPAGDKPPHYSGSGGTVADFSIDVLSRGIRAWIPACAGMTIAEIGAIRRHVLSRVTPFSYQSFIPVVTGTPRCENWCASPVAFGCRWCSHPHPFWIPAFAGMTNWGVGLTSA